MTSIFNSNNLETTFVKRCVNLSISIPTQCLQKHCRKIKLNFVYNFDQKVTTLKNIEIDSLMSQKVNQILNKFVSKDTLLQNRVYFKNLINKALKSYAG